MSRSYFSWIGSHRRSLAVASACALGAVGTLALTGSAGASGAPAHPAVQQSCSTATLTGTYLFAGEGWTVAGGQATPGAFAGTEHFDGSGAVQGTNTFSANGTVTRGSHFTGTYTVAPDCTGTLTIAGALHFDIYPAASGDSFVYIQTDPGSVSATTEHRATRA
ncbi:hypothetical protein [Streptomyces sp. NBC_00212]|uniref:hypothetical protein n=1 Tax=Streptomyces sp. NBC_00212 TaxID=2975684 RepID=UPI002F913BC9